MNINLEVDVGELQRRMNLTAKNVAFAAVGAVNDTTKQAQKDVNAHVRSKFVIRKPGLFFGGGGRVGGVAAKIAPFASVKQGRAYAEIAVGRLSNKSGPLLLAQFEEGGERKPFTAGAKHVAAPVLGRPARPSISRGVPPAYTFAGLKFKYFKGGKAVRRRRRGRTVDETLHGEFGRLRLDKVKGPGWKGLQRTYIVKDVGVFQRFGPARRDTRLIHGFLPPFRLDERLDFVGVVKRSAAIWFPEFMNRRLIHEIQTTKGGR